jgi:glutaredoxin 3
MNAPEVLMDVTSWCPYCARARSVLADKGLTVREIDVDAVRGAREEMTARSGRSTVPQIFVGSEYVGGCDDLLELDASGRLDSLLKTTGAT